MFYREAGQFKTSYVADQAAFPVREDRIGIILIALVAAIAVPLLGGEFFLNTVMIPFLVFALATVGLNVLTGYCGQLSLGTGAFMGVGAYACYKLSTLFPEVNIIVWVLASGFVSAAVGVLFGLPSLRIKGFYLAVATLAAQFFLEWCFIRVPWLYNFNQSGAIEVPTHTLLGIAITGPTAAPVTRYLVVLAILALLTWLTGNLLRGRIGRTWMMIRDMDIAAELMGVRPLVAKLSAFAVSSYLCGVAGALYVFLWLGAAEPSSFSIRLSFEILFMVILGGLGSVAGSYMGAAFIFILPIGLRMIPDAFGLDVQVATLQHINSVLLGVLIIGVLIIEPHGLARLWSLLRQKLRVWPFPY